MFLFNTNYHFPDTMIYPGYRLLSDVIHPADRKIAFLIKDEPHTDSTHIKDPVQIISYAIPNEV